MLLTILVAFGVGCGSLLRSHPPAAPEEQPLTHVEDDEDEQDAEERDERKAPPPQYGNRVVRDAAGGEERKPSKAGPADAQESN